MAFLSRYQAFKAADEDSKDDGGADPALSSALAKMTEAPAQKQQEKRAVITALEGISEEMSASVGALDAVSNDPDRDKVAAVLQWRPPDLTDGKQFPKLYAILQENDLVRPFLFSVNESMLTVSVSLAGVAQVRDKMAQVLKLNGGSSAESSTHISKIVGGTQRAISLIGDQVGSFVVAMSKTASETGKVAYALKYHADPTKLADGLEEAIGSVVTQNDSLSGELQKACDSIDSSLERLAALIKRDNALDTMDKEIDDLRAKYEKAEKIAADADKAYHEAKTRLETERAVAEEEKRQHDERADLLDAQADSQKAEYARVTEEINTCSRRMETLRTERTAERQQLVASQKKLAADLASMNRSFAESAKKGRAARAEAMVKLQSQISELQQLMKSADGGGTTHRRHGLFGWGGSTTETRPDQKAPIRAMIAQRQQQLIEMRRENEQWAADEAKRVREAGEASRKSAAAQHAAQLKGVDARFEGDTEEVKAAHQQILDMRAAVEQQQEQLDKERGALGAKRAKTEERLTKAQEQLKELDSQQRHVKTATAADRDEARERLKKKLAKREALLKDISEKFGQDSYTFAVFMKLLVELQTRASNMSLAFKSITNSVAAVQAAFGTDFFFKQMRDVPEQYRGTAMQELARHFQTACMAGQSALQQPIRALLLRDATKVALEEAAEGARAALPATGGPQIEDVTDAA